MQITNFMCSNRTFMELKYIHDIFQQIQLQF